MRAQDRITRLRHHDTRDRAARGRVATRIHRVNPHALVAAQMRLLGRFHKKHRRLQRATMGKPENMPELVRDHVLDKHIRPAAPPAGRVRAGAVPRRVVCVGGEVKTHVVQHHIGFENLPGIRVVPNLSEPEHVWRQTHRTVAFEAK